MPYVDFLARMAAIPGTSGYEAPIAAAFAEAFAPHCDEVHTDGVHNVIAVQRGSGAGPRIMLCAHLDEVGLMTLNVEENGSVRFLSLGVAAQTLPAQAVRILTQDGPIHGVIGAAPPQMTDEAARRRVTPVDELFIDTGLAPDEAKRRIAPGTCVQLLGTVKRLQNERVTGKALDDRACAAILLDCAEQMQHRRHDADVYYVISAREERDSLGALAAAERIRPDAAIILDVTHGEMPDCRPGETYPLDATVLFAGPNAHRKVTALLLAHAERLHVKTRIEAVGGNSYTDAWAVQIGCEGVPCAIMSLPLKYMHTTVEMGDQAVMRDQAHLLCEAVCAMRRGWEETLCF